MNQSSFKPLLRFLATVAFSILSYAAMAQSAPSIDTCRQTLSSFQKRLYAHFLGGPAALRTYVWEVQAIHPTDIYEADDWARHVSAQTCTAAGDGTPTNEDPTAPASVSQIPAAIERRIGGT